MINLVLIQRKEHQDGGGLWGCRLGWWRQVMAIKTANTGAREDKGMLGGMGMGERE